MPFLPTGTSRQAHAKLNLALSVGSPGPPKGYHPIASWMVLLELADTVELLPLEPGLSHEIVWAPEAPKPSPIDWPVEQDLAVRALGLVADRLPPVRVRVSKRVPVGGGLGGGSSDAAAVLLLARRLNSSLSIDELLEAGAQLGSDVPFFILAEESRRSMIVTGFGEQVEPVPASVPQLGVDLVIPEFGCATPMVYRRWDELSPSHREPDAGAVHKLANSRLDPSHFFNDLESPASSLYPELADILAVIRASGRHALLAGSGSTVASFGSPLRAPPALCRLVRSAILGVGEG